MKFIVRTGKLYYVRDLFAWPGMLVPVTRAELREHMAGRLEFIFV